MSNVSGVRRLRWAKRRAGSLRFTHGNLVPQMVYTMGDKTYILVARPYPKELKLPASGVEHRESGLRSHVQRELFLRASHCKGNERR